MKIQLLSDIHLEFRPFTFKPNPHADIVVLAGDFGPFDICEDHIRNLLRNLHGKPAIVVLGNHDYYGSGIEETVENWLLMLQSYSNVMLLNDSEFTYHGYTFVGGTLWSDFSLHEPEVKAEDAMRMALRGGISDFSQIHHNNRRLLPQDVPALHEKCTDAIEGVVSLGRPTIVVTHFVPSPACIHSQWKNNPLNPYFTSPCDYLMRPNVEAWLYGHTHSSGDILIGTTRVVCNPRGYHSHENKEFNSQLIVEV